MSKAQLELLLYKIKYNQKTILDLINNFSTITIESIIKDLSCNIKSQENVYIFSDGGCKENGKKNAKAGYSVYCKEYDIFNKTREIIKNPSNNVAELSGIRYIFKILSTDENKELFKNKNIIIVSDSKYSIDCITKWSNNWIKNGWLNSKKEVVKNKEIIQEILEYKKNIFNSEFKHVFSHTKQPENKNSIEWMIWNGNNIVDNNINKMFDKKY